MTGAPMPAMPELWERTAGGLIVPAPKLIVPSHLRSDVLEHGFEDSVNGECERMMATPRPEKPVRGVDLFSGCGGFSLGMQMAGIDVIAAVEWNPHAVVAYLSNLGSPRGCAVAYVSEADKARLAKVLKGTDKTTSSGWIGEHNRYPGNGCRAMIMGDASQVTAEMIHGALEATESDAPIDVVFGGPPCQGMSSSGRQDPGDPRNNLVLEFVRIADELGAETFAMENVPPLITQAKFRPLFDELVRRAHRAGFTVVANVIDAANYGVPQRRRRAFVVGTRGKAASRPFAFAMPTNWSFVHAPGEKRTSFLGAEPEADEDRTDAGKADRRARDKAAKKARKRQRRGQR